MFELRPIDKTKDEELRFVYSVRTHPGVASQLLGTPPVDFDAHKAWVTSNIDNGMLGKSRWLFLCLRNGVPVGYAQIYNISMYSLEVGWALHPDFQGQGLGGKFVEALLHETSSRFHFLPSVVLEVKADNLRARHLYKRAGFFEFRTKDGIIGMIRHNVPPSCDAEITYVGHAGFLLKRGDVKLLCDPWFYGAFYGSWHPYPYNRHVMNEAFDFTHLYISHGHEDHYDKRFLELLNDDVKIIAANFKNGEMKRLLSRFKNVTYLDHLEKTTLGDITIQMFMDVVSPKNDSAISIDFGYKILNTNDCYLPHGTLPKVDMLWAQFSGAFHYPHCYDFSSEAKKEKTDALKARYFKDLLTRVQSTQCSTYVPSAGPACFLDPIQKDLNNPNGIFYSWSDFEPAFHEDVDLLKPVPGNKFYLKDKEWCLFRHLGTVSTEQYQKETENERQDYFAAIVTQEELEKYFSTLRRKHAHLLKLQSKAFNLTIGDTTYAINLSPDPKTVYPIAQAPAGIIRNYSFNVPSILMKDILNGGRWDAAFLSNRIMLHRDVDIYDSLLFQLLYADTDPERTKELAKNLGGEVEMTEKNGWCYQRYCPHAGADLSTAKIEEGIIECPRHNWKWDLSTGKCLVGSDIQLHCKGK